MADGSTTTSSRRAPLGNGARSSPFLPSPLERMVLAAFPLLLVFGAVFSVFSPATRNAAYDPVSQSHSQDPALAPSYFARKSNVFNTFFVKRGWAWVTAAFVAFVALHPSVVSQGQRARAAARWVGVTACWFFITQWFFGPPVIDRGFRWTGGKCELAERTVYMGGPAGAGEDASVGEMLTAVACKAAGGKWKGGHDISGHVFLLVLGTVFLLGEIGWPLLRSVNWAPPDDRVIVMPDGAVKGAGVEAETVRRQKQGPGGGGGDDSANLGIAGKFALSVVGLSVWMLLMTAIYFHTWFEKFTGLLTALISWYAIYIVPRFVPALRDIVGLPGI